MIAIRFIALLSLFLLLPLFATRKPDTACFTVRCSAGFRCQKGKCIPQKKQPIKRHCSNPKIGKKLNEVKCTNSDRSKNCSGAKNALTCGFTSSGGKMDFTNNCLPCLNPAVNSFYRLPCSDSPVVCLQSEECINGKCFPLYDADTDRDLQICNKSTDCESSTDICVANKCVCKHELLKTLRKGSQIYSQ